MVDAQPVHEPFRDQVEDQPVAVIEHVLPLHAQADEAVDGEESPVVELFLRAAPVFEPVVLALQQQVEGVWVLLDPVQVEVLDRVG